MTDHPTTQPPPQQDDFLPLNETLNFLPEDLDANREGQLSRRQANRLRRRDMIGLLVGNTLALGLLGVGMWLLWQEVVLLGGLVMLLGVGLFVLTRMGRGRYTAEANTGTVASATGAAHLETKDYASPNGNVTEYRVTVGGEVFVISRDTFIALDEAASEGGNRFTLYYLPGTRLVLSAEPLDRVDSTPTNE